VKAVTLAAGDVMFFSTALLHRSQTNMTNEERLAINLILFRGEALHTGRSTAFPYLFGARQLDPCNVRRLRTLPWTTQDAER
jgi:ectoine hydroxylase-related dioxygenase (phytanoyl-CoA dioxygenase family)